MEERDGNETAKLTEKAVKGLLATREGCFFLGLVLSRSGVDEPSLDVGNIYATCAKEGRRSVGIWPRDVISRDRGLLQMRRRLRRRVRGGQGAQGTKGRYFLKRSDNA